MTQRWWGYDYCAVGYDKCLYGKKSRRLKRWWGCIFFWQGRVLVSRKVPDSMRKPDSIWQRHPTHFFMYSMSPVAFHYKCYQRDIKDENTKKYHIDDNVIEKSRRLG